MKKCDLKNGMLVETADGKVYRVLNGFLRNDNTTINISCYDRNLFNGPSGSEIVRVFEGDDFLHFDTRGKDLIWERTVEPITVLHKAIIAYGEDSQMDMAIEEMSELTKALLKHRRAKNGPEIQDFEQIRNNITEEIADVTIVLEQLKIMFDNEDAVEKIKSEKIQRLKQRLEE